MVMLIWVNIGSGNGLVPDGTKPLPEAMLTEGIDTSRYQFLFYHGTTKLTLN